jgi:hypothetical protein
MQARPRSPIKPARPTDRHSLQSANAPTPESTSTKNPKEHAMSIKDTARKIPGVAAVEGVITGALASEQDLPITGYDKQSATDIAAQLNGFSQRELRMIDAYERKNQNRSTITDKIAKLSGDEPWSGYDEQNVDAITTALDGADAQTARKVKAYESDHKARTGVIETASKHIDRAA